MGIIEGFYIIVVWLEFDFIEIILVFLRKKCCNLNIDVKEIIKEGNLRSLVNVDNIIIIVSIYFNTC